MQHRDKSSLGVWDAFCWDRAEAGLNSGTAGSGFGVGVEAALWKWKFDGEKKEKKKSGMPVYKSQEMFPLSPASRDTFPLFLDSKGM